MSLYTLYRFFDEDETLLYVGQTTNPPRRFKEHAAAKNWWLNVASIDLEHFPDQQSLNYAERQAIVLEDPLHNIALAERFTDVSNAEKRRTLEWIGWICISNRGAGSFYKPDRPSAVYTRAAAWTQWVL